MHLDKISPSLLHAAQSQLSQPVLLEEVLRPSDNLCGASLYLFQCVHAALVGEPRTRHFRCSWSSVDFFLLFGCCSKISCNLAQPQTAVVNRIKVNAQQTSKKVKLLMPPHPCLHQFCLQPSE